MNKTLFFWYLISTECNCAAVKFAPANANQSINRCYCNIRCNFLLYTTSNRIEKTIFYVWFRQQCFEFLSFHAEIYCVVELNKLITIRFVLKKHIHSFNIDVIHDAIDIQRSNWRWRQDLTISNSIMICKCFNNKLTCLTFSQAAINRNEAFAFVEMSIYWKETTNVNHAQCLLFKKIITILTLYRCLQSATK